ncbi:MAG: LiaF domain-containing protein, partial [Candidatus Aminicenantaceae bacterium]
NLDLRGLILNSLDIDMGVGELTVDLSGEQKQSFDVSVDGGVGSATIYLPIDVGVRVEVDGGIGSVNAKSMIKDRGVYINDAYGKTEVTIDVEVDAGIGSIDLILR